MATSEEGWVHRSSLRVRVRAHRGAEDEGYLCAHGTASWAHQRDGHPIYLHLAIEFVQLNASARTLSHTST